ncbi:MAG TPA: transporter substrate-binding domain-containing protein [Gammaproteobacteria bacterium]|nr:transporter substrate-binding domain-containing protein [Gammaproteobacteria bacterium]
MNRYKLIFNYAGHLLVLFIAYYTLLHSSPAHSMQTLVLNTAVGAPVSNESQTGFADKVVGEALRRIGYKLQTVRMPAERALINANRGIDDGDLLRVAGLQKKYTNLVAVPEPVMNVDIVLFSKNQPDFKVAGWDSVASYSLAIISGWKIMEKNFGKLGDKVEMIKTDNAEQSFTLLIKDRVDFVAYSSWSGLNYLKKRNITDVKVLSPPLASPFFYVYLHKKYKKIIPDLAVELKKMKKDGTTQTYFDEILKPLMQ